MAQPVSYATQDSLAERDFNINRVITDYDIDVDVYFDLASEYILRVLEFDWWRQYADYQGFSYSQVDANGNTVTAFNPDRLILNNPDLINIHCFYTLYLIYRGLSTQLSSPFETAMRNSKYWLDEFNTYTNRLESVSDFYDRDGDGETEIREQKYSADGSQRYGRRYVR